MFIHLLTDMKYLQLKDSELDFEVAEREAEC